jgi:hypothetical protein
MGNTDSRSPHCPGVDLLTPPYLQSPTRQELLEENRALLDAVDRMTTIDAEGAAGGLAEIATLARRYLPVEQHLTVAQLLRLAYARGRLDGGDLAVAPIVLRTCPVCLGKGEGR